MWNVWAACNVRWGAIAGQRPQTRTRAAAELTTDSTVADADLLLDFAHIAGRLAAQLRRLRSREDVFDAFLLAAGLHQILEDHLHRDVCSLGKVAEHLPALVDSRPARVVATGARGLRSVGLAGRQGKRSERFLIRWERHLAALVQDLASAVVDSVEDLQIAAEFLGGSEALPVDLRQSVVRLPHCFRSFDQRPEDLARMVDSFAQARPDRTAPLIMVGLRTAGTYLAPLVVALLRRRGYRDVSSLTLRPGQPWLWHERRLLRGGVDRGALALVVDEPPRSGSQLARAARELGRAGIPRHAVVLFVPLFGSSPPMALESYEIVALPWEDWSIHARLEPDAVKADLGALLPGADIERVERLDGEAAPRRGHVLARFSVSCSGADLDPELAVEGVGLGYLGRQALAVATPLGDFVPKVYGVRDGLLYRKWLPGSGDQKEDERLAERIAVYVHARNRALAVSEDMSRRLSGRDTVLDLGARLLRQAFGRGGLGVRPLAQRISRELLAPARPSVVDGSMRLDHWFAPPDAPYAARKVDFHARAFSNEERSCYDPVYDLAGAAASSGDPDFVAALLRAYEQRSGEKVSPEAWLLYQLIHCQWGERPKAQAGRDVERLLALEQTMARAHQRYVGEAISSDLVPATSGPLCALDVDWVLEVRWLDFPALSPASARALRALIRHGYRPVIATGRSLAEVQDRCAAYRLAGGVAEYGAVVYDHLSGRTRTLLDAEDEATLAELRRAVGGMPGVHVHPAHQHSVRAYRTENGLCRGLEAATIEEALASVENRERLRVVPALSQTDFVAQRVDKGMGVRALAGQGRIAMAMGDAVDDLPMLRMAERAFAPANADPAVGPGVSGAAEVERAGRPYGAGVTEAVSKLIGHAPGRCRVCAPPRQSPAGTLLLEVLGALDGSAREKAWHAAAAACRLAGR